MRKKFKILILIFLLVVVIGVFFFFGISGGKRAQLLCRVTGGAWTECGSGCGPFTKKDVDQRLTPFYAQYVNSPAYSVAPLSFEEFKKKYLRGEFAGFEYYKLCPDVCRPQCGCPKNKPYWSNIRGCIK